MKYHPGLNRHVSHRHCLLLQMCIRMHMLHYFDNNVMFPYRDLNKALCSISSFKAEQQDHQCAFKYCARKVH